MSLIQWFAGRELRLLALNLGLPWIGVITVMSAAFYYREWWAVGLLFTIEAVIVYRLRYEIDEITKRVGEMEEMDADG